MGKSRIKNEKKIIIKSCKECKYREWKYGETWCTLKSTDEIRFMLLPKDKYAENKEYKIPIWCPLEDN